MGVRSVYSDELNMIYAEKKMNNSDPISAYQIQFVGMRVCGRG